MWQDMGRFLVMQPTYQLVTKGGVKVITCTKIAVLCQFSQLHQIIGKGSPGLVGPFKGLKMLSDFNHALLVVLLHQVHDLL